ncbi:hypothetical protein ACFT38_42595 [Streptomyces sp. NPDC056975]
MDGRNETWDGTIRAGSAGADEQLWPAGALPAGEEEWGDEPHIHRGID